MGVLKSLFWIFSSQSLSVYFPYSIYLSNTEPKEKTLPKKPIYYDYFEEKFTRTISEFSVFSDNQWQNIFGKPPFQALGVPFPPQSMLQPWMLCLKCSCSSTLVAGERELFHLWIFGPLAKIFITDCSSKIMFSKSQVFKGWCI